MPLKLWIGGGGHFFVDTFLDCDVQVGQAYQKSGGSWTVEVNDEYVEGVPNLDAANIAFNTLTVLADGQPVGPILLGLNAAAHIVAPSVTVRGLVNMSAVAVHDAQVSANARAVAT